MFPEHGRVRVVTNGIKPQVWRLEQEAEAHTLNCEHEAERANTERHKSLNSQSLPPGTCFLQSHASSTSQPIPTQLEGSVQMPESVEDTALKPAHHSLHNQKALFP